jgi:phosphoglycolate phosphatase-like HAD superfamily hydrolase
MIRLVLFDIDGTLIASGGAGVKAFGEVARSTFGRPEGMAGLEFAGRTDLSIIRQFFGRCGIPPEPEWFRRFLDDYVYWLDHYLGTLPGRVLPGVTEALAVLSSLEEPPVVGLLTGNIRLGAEIKLRHYRLWDGFELGAFGDDHEDRNQLAVVARQRGAERCGKALEGSEILVIGDTPLDIACAEAIGARCLAVATGGYTMAELERHRPFLTVPNLAQVDIGDLCRR